MITLQQDIGQLMITLEVLFENMPATLIWAKCAYQEELQNLRIADFVLGISDGCAKQGSATMKHQPSR